MKLLKKINGKHTGLFAAGLLLGTAGVKVLSSKDAKNVYCLLYTSDAADD